jgi:predicted PurR-regulated permease PerM
MSDEPSVPYPLRFAAALSWRLLVVVGSIVILAFVVAKLRIVILPVFVALLLATQLTPIVDRIQDRGAPRWAGALISLLLGGAIVTGIVAAVVGTVVADFDRLEIDFEEGLAEVGEFFVDELNVPQTDVDSAIDDLLGTVRSNSGTILGGVFTGASLALEIAAGTVFAVIFLFFFLKDGRTMWGWLVRLAPSSRRADARAIGQRTWHILGAYFRGTTAVAAVDGVFIGIALLIIGVPFVLPLAVLTFFGGFIPIVGAVAAGLVAVLVALVAEGLTEAILVAVAVVIVQQLEGSVLAPVLVGRSLKLHPVVIIMAVTVGGLVWGIIGAALAVPLVAVLTGVVMYLHDPDPPDFMAREPDDPADGAEGSDSDPPADVAGDAVPATGA